MSDLLQFTNLCNRSTVATIDQPQLVYVLSELIPGAGVIGTRLPLNFTLVLDRSGSMAGEKIRTMREAVKNIIDQLSSDDIISIVVFESRTQVLVPAQAVADKAEINRQVEKIRDGGGTNLAPGLQEGLNQVKQFHKGERVSRIVLLTDGEATDSENDSRRIALNAGHSSGESAGTLRSRVPTVSRFQQTAQMFSGFPTNSSFVKVPLTLPDSIGAIRCWR